MVRIRTNKQVKVHNENYFKKLPERNDKMSEEINVVGEKLEDIKDRVVSKNTYFLPIGSMITCDYRPERTRIWYDPKTNIIIEITRG